MASLINAAPSLFEPAAGVLADQPTSGASLLNRTSPLAAPPTQADAAEANSQAYGDWVAKERADGVAKGLLDPKTGWPTKAGLEDAARQLAQSVLLGSTAPEMKGAAPGLIDAPGFTAYHGSPHSFDQFKSEAIGTGEGAQAYGHGLYFADREATAQGYRDVLSDGQKPTVGGQPFDPADIMHKAAFYVDQEGSVPAAQARVADMLDALNRGANAPDVRGDVYAESNREMYAAAASKIQEVQQVLADHGAAIPPYKAPGHMYQVNVAADPAHFLDWDKPRDQLAPNVQAFAKENYPDAWQNAADGSSLYQGMVRHQQGEYVGMSKPNASQAAALVSQSLRDAGIPGIRYLDGGSRADGAGTSNHVVFDPATIAILRKYGIAGVMGGGAAAAASSPGEK